MVWHIPTILLMGDSGRCYTERPHFTNKRKHAFGDFVLCIHVCAYLFMCVSDHVYTHAYWGQRLTLGIFLNHIPTLLRQAPSLVHLDYQQISESSSHSLHNSKVPGTCYNICGCWDGSEVRMSAELAPYWFFVTVLVENLFLILSSLCSPMT